LGTCQKTAKARKDQAVEIEPYKFSHPRGGFDFGDGSREDRRTWYTRRVLALGGYTVSYMKHNLRGRGFDKK